MKMMMLTTELSMKVAENNEKILKMMIHNVAADELVVDTQLLLVVLPLRAHAWLHLSVHEEMKSHTWICLEALHR